MGLEDQIRAVSELAAVFEEWGTVSGEVFVQEVLTQSGLSKGKLLG